MIVIRSGSLWKNGAGWVYVSVDLVSTRADQQPLLSWLVFAAVLVCVNSHAHW